MLRAVSLFAQQGIGPIRILLGKRRFRLDAIIRAVVLVRLTYRPDAVTLVAVFIIRLGVLRVGKNGPDSKQRGRGTNSPPTNEGIHQFHASDRSGVDCR
jgi:hypothetical protein